jgi:hypothetical protein
VGKVPVFGNPYDAEMEFPIRVAALAGVAPIKPDTSKAADASKTNFFTEAPPRIKNKRQ